MKPWTEAHRREALRRTYEILAEQADDSPSGRASQTVRVDVGSEDEWVDCLGWALDIADSARIDREVARVRALAEGQLVRETERVVLWPDGIKRALQTPAAEVPKGWPILRVTRIRRAR